MSEIEPNKAVDRVFEFIQKKYSPGINLSDADLIITHIEFCDRMRSFFNDFQSYDEKGNETDYYDSELMDRMIEVGFKYESVGEIIAWVLDNR